MTTVRLRQRARATARSMQVRADRREIERLLAREVGDAEAAADVEQAHRRGRASRERKRELDGFCCASQIASARRFCEPLKMWKPRTRAAARRSRAASPARARRRCRTAWGRRPSSCPEVLSSKSGLTRTATRGRAPRRLAMREALHLAFGLEVDDDAGGDRLLELARRSCPVRRS